MSEPVEVLVPCTCPETPHADDIVRLDPEAGFELGLAVNASLALYDDAVALEVAMGKAYLQYGIRSWTKTDAKEAPVPVTLETIHDLLPWARGGEVVAQRANELYYESIVAPLVRRAQMRSQAGSTSGVTSRKSPTSLQRRKRSGSSSTAASAAS